MSDGQTFKRRHATDPPLWWCDDEFAVEPARLVGGFHPAAPSGGWPIRRCLVCGDEGFYEDDGGPVDTSDCEAVAPKGKA